MGMDEQIWILFGLGVIALILGGSISGIVSSVRLSRLTKRLTSVEQQLFRLKTKPGAAPPLATQPKEPPRATEKPVSSYESIEPSEQTPTEAPAASTTSQTTPPAPPPLPHPSEPAEPPAAPTRPTSGFPGFDEVTLGTKWMVWVGVVLTLVSLAFFLKYLYDNNIIEERGRLAIGTAFGVFLIGLGERFRRKQWQALFQSLTGAGIAAFYMCIFFSFQVYELSAQSTAMGLAVLVTLFAVVMAVAHNAIAMAVLGLIGGFMSPLLLSTGQNHPYALFTYIAILDLLAVGAAYYRRWRVIDVLCFVGTAVIYALWYGKFQGIRHSDLALYKETVFTPGLVFTSIFYVIFLAIPTLRGLVRREEAKPENMALLLANGLLTFFSYYALLYHDYRQALGFVVLGQALTVFLLFQAWCVRVGAKNRTAESLLVIALGFVTVAIPIQLKLYAIPVAWAMEGAVVTYLGVRFRQNVCKVGGAVALLLAVAGLTSRMPLHKLPFVPVFNIPFGSWAAVVLCAFATSFILLKKAGDSKQLDPIFTVATFLIGFVLACSLLTMEVAQYWTTQRMPHFAIYKYSALAVLWAAISAGAAWAVGWKRQDNWAVLPIVCCAITLVILAAGFTEYRIESSWLMANWAFAPRLAIPVALWLSALAFARLSEKRIGTTIEVMGHVALTILLAFELMRWSQFAELINSRMGMSLVSAAWALQALSLIWLGLARRRRALRMMGFALFAITIFKVCFIDMSTLERVYQIVSFGASGMLLVVGGAFYQRYLPRLMGEQTEEEEEEER